MDKEVENIIQDILLEELSLEESYGTSNDKLVPSVYIVAPNISLGTTDKLQIGIQSIGSSIISNHSRTEDVTTIDDETEEEITTYTQYNEATINDNIQIDISSKNSDARTRRHEVFMALNSIYSKQMQEKYGFRIFNLPMGFTNTSAAEGGTTVYRYTVTFATQYMRVYTKEVDYYDTFTTNVNVNDGQAEDSFTIDEDTEIYPSS